ncbi:MAG: DUF393 domain-containing protein [Bryobacterales bacterium]|nr:DUF393 domain-containing protein [Bryobacterales bacterium]
MAYWAKHTVFYDGDCGFCKRSVGLLRALDWFGRFRYATLQSAEARATGIPIARNPTEMVLCTGVPGAGRLWGGWRAVKQIWLRMPVFYLVMAGTLLVHPVVTACLLIGLTPFGNPLGDWLYRLVARNRHRLPASTCSLENP